MAAGDFSEFEFNKDDDNLPATKQIRVEDLSKSNVRIRPPTLGLNDVAAAAAAGNVEFEFEFQLQEEESVVDSTEPKTALGMGTNPRSDEEETNKDQETKEDEERMKDLKPDTKPLNDFKEYVRLGRSQNTAFSKDMEAAIELMDLMDKNGGSMKLYKSILKWHMKHLEVENVVSAEALQKHLLARYHLGPSLPVEKKVSLPATGEVVHVPVHDFKAQLIDLLSDPRWKDKDKFYYNDDPHEDPPQEVSKVGDIMTGLAHRKTWEGLVKDDPWTADG